jgi:hypothetical protein
METAISTGELVADTVIVSRPGALCAILVITDGTNAATAIIYDNVAASGKKIGEWTVPGASQYGGRNWVIPVQFEIGLYLDLTGTGASAIVELV